MINENAKKRFNDWWAHKKSDRPLIRLVVEREKPLNKDALIDLSHIKEPEKWWSDPKLHADWAQNAVNTHDYMYEAVPYIDLNYGPGSMAAYLGIKPNFRSDTVWYEHIRAGSLNEIPLPRFDPEAPYLVRHLKQFKETVALTQGEFPVCIPDILENIDVLALLRGNEECCTDIYDEPETLVEYLDAVADIYMDYYNLFYDIVRKNKECMYTAFGIWGADKTAKIQCDFSCLMSPSSFDELIIPYLKRQTEEIAYTMYHLDGKDAVRHLKSVCGLQKLNALQWTPGAGNPDGGSECWYPVYDAAMEAGKSIWVGLEDGTAREMAQKAQKIAKRYNNTGVYFFVLPSIKEKDKVRFTEIFGE